MTGGRQTLDEMFRVSCQNSFNFFNSSEKIKVNDFWYDINIGYCIGNVMSCRRGRHATFYLKIFFFFFLNRNSIEIDLLCEAYIGHFIFALPTPTLCHSTVPISAHLQAKSPPTHTNPQHVSKQEERVNSNNWTHVAGATPKAFYVSSHLIFTKPYNKETIHMQAYFTDEETKSQRN